MFCFCDDDEGKGRLLSAKSLWIFSLVGGSKLKAITTNSCGLIFESFNICIIVSPFVIDNDSKNFPIFSVGQKGGDGDTERQDYGKYNKMYFKDV